jgi:hypothetical protein
MRQFEKFLRPLIDLQNVSTWKEGGQRTDESKKSSQVRFATKNRFLTEGSSTLSLICRRDGENSV